MLRGLSKSQRNFLLLQQGVFSVIINFLLNIAVTWVIKRDHTELRYSGLDGLNVDLLLTGFLLPFITCLAISSAIQKRVSTGQLEQVEMASEGTLGFESRPIFVRALFSGLFGVVTAITVLYFLKQVYPESISLMAFLWIKGIWAGALGGMVTPWIAYCAMGSILKSNID